MDQKSVFITGGAGGLGRATVETFAAHGWQVFAADYNQQALASLEQLPHVIPMQVDIGQASSVEAAFEQVSRNNDGLDGVINMAGVMQVGSMVELDEESVLQLLNVNALGMFRVNKRFLPLVMKRQGRIVNISSENGWESGGPFNGAYSMSKHAVEAYSDSLRRELMLLGIRVIKVQPGPFKTGMITTTKQLFAEATERSVYFKPQLRYISGMLDREWEKANPPAILAGVVYRAMTAKHPRTAYSIRPDPQRAFLDLLPASLADRLLKGILKNAGRQVI
jgi:NAD(P)-dependent dehydrogenase (short-subunit alcohol dehydrogenase family)